MLPPSAATAAAARATRRSSGADPACRDEDDGAVAVEGRVGRGAAGIGERGATLEPAAVGAIVKRSGASAPAAGSAENTIRSPAGLQSAVAAKSAGSVSGVVAPLATSSTVSVTPVGSERRPTPSLRTTSSTIASPSGDQRGPAQTSRGSTGVPHSVRSAPVAASTATRTPWCAPSPTVASLQLAIAPPSGDQAGSS